MPHVSNSRLSGEALLSSNTRAKRLARICWAKSVL